MQNGVKTHGIDTGTFALRTENSMGFHEIPWKTGQNGTRTCFLRSLVFLHTFSMALSNSPLGSVRPDWNGGDRRNTIMNHRMEKGFRRVFSRFPYFFHYTKTWGIRWAYENINIFTGLFSSFFVPESFRGSFSRPTEKWWTASWLFCESKFITFLDF